MGERNNKKKAGSLDRQCLPADDGASARLDPLTHVTSLSTPRNPIMQRSAPKVVRARTLPFCDTRMLL
jgi:hypothetical protein